MKKSYGTQQIVAIAIGAALFAVLMVYGGIPVFTNTKLSPAYLIPVIVGGLYGPLPAALVAFIGNIFADLLGGWGYWFDWSIGNFILGLLVGTLPLYGAKIREGIFNIKQAVILAIIAIVGNAVAFGLITPLFTQLFYGGELEITVLQAQVAVISNASIIILVGIPVLFLLANRYKNQMDLVEED